MKDQDESLESLLSLTPQIDDAGFTESVMHRLPPRRDLQRIRSASLLAAAFTSCAIVAAIPGARRFIADFGHGFADTSIVSGLSLLSAGAVAALLIWGALTAVTSET
jgi:hypothetical protein